MWKPNVALLSEIFKSLSKWTLILHKGLSWPDHWSTKRSKVKFAELKRLNFRNASRIYTPVTDEKWRILLPVFFSNTYLLSYYFIQFISLTHYWFLHVLAVENICVLISPKKGGVGGDSCIPHVPLLRSLTMPKKELPENRYKEMLHLFKQWNWW